jgi:hypothetical protein
MPLVILCHCGAFNAEVVYRAIDIKPHFAVERGRYIAVIYLYTGTMSLQPSLPEEYTPEAFECVKSPKSELHIIQSHYSTQKLARTPGPRMTRCYDEKFSGRKRVGNSWIRLEVVALGLARGSMMYIADGGEGCAYGGQGDGF